MRGVLAVAELRLRGATAARLPWIVPLAFAAGIAIAGWAPGTDAHARAAAADDLALSAATAAALVVVLILSATTFAEEIRTAVAQTILATPLSRPALVAGGALGHAAFGGLLCLALALAAMLGLDAGGVGARARAAVRPTTDVTLADTGADGVAVISRETPEITGRFVVPAGLRANDELRFHLAPRGQVESEWSPGGVLAISVGPPGIPGPAYRVHYKAGVAFQAAVPAGDLPSGLDAEVRLRRIEGGWKLRFAPGSVEIGGAPESFVANVVLAVLCVLPLLAMAAAAGTTASARLGAAASSALVLFLLLLFAGRDVIIDSARFVVEEGEAQAADAAGDGHDAHAGHAHEHFIEVSPLQVGLARGALVGLRAVPDAGAFWRFGDLANGRAVTVSDLGESARAGFLPTVLLIGASWFLLRKRELTAEP